MSAEDSKYFELRYDPEPSGRFQYIQQGYWYCHAKPGYDGDGLTPIDAMAACMIAMSKALCERDADER